MQAQCGSESDCGPTPGGHRHWALAEQSTLVLGLAPGGITPHFDSKLYSRVKISNGLPGGPPSMVANSGYADSFIS